MDVKFTPYHAQILHCAKNSTTDEEIQECKEEVYNSIAREICDKLEGTQLDCVWRGGYDEPSEYEYSYATEVSIDIISFMIYYMNEDGVKASEEIDTFEQTVLRLKQLLKSGITAIYFDDVINVDYEVTNTDVEVGW